MQKLFGFCRKTFHELGIKIQAYFLLNDIFKRETKTKYKSQRSTVMFAFGFACKIATFQLCLSKVLSLQDVIFYGKYAV